MTAWTIESRAAAVDAVLSRAPVLPVIAIDALEQAVPLARTLVEAGTLAKSGGRIRLTRPVSEISVPETVQEVIGARIDRLSSSAKRTVQVAAVLGRQFRRDQLEQLLAGESIAVAAELEELEHRGIVHRKTVLSEEEFRFGVFQQRLVTIEEHNRKKLSYQKGINHMSDMTYEELSRFYVS